MYCKSVLLCLPANYPTSVLRTFPFLVPQGHCAMGCKSSHPYTAPPRVADGLKPRERSSLSSWSFSLGWTTVRWKRESRIISVECQRKSGFLLQYIRTLLDPVLPDIQELSFSFNSVNSPASLARIQFYYLHSKSPKRYKMELNPK